MRLGALSVSFRPRLQPATPQRAFERLGNVSRQAQTKYIGSLTNAGRCHEESIPWVSSGQLEDHQTQ